MERNRIAKKNCVPKELKHCALMSRKISTLNSKLDYSDKNNKISRFPILCHFALSSSLDLRLKFRRSGRNFARSPSFNP